MNILEKHQVKIAKATLKMSDIGAAIMGGMTKEHARQILLRYHPQSYIDRLENS